MSPALGREHHTRSKLPRRYDATSPIGRLKEASWRLYEAAHDLCDEASMSMWQEQPEHHNFWVVFFGLLQTGKVEACNQPSNPLPVATTNHPIGF
jgi:hypothetical protein